MDTQSSESDTPQASLLWLTTFGLWNIFWLLLVIGIVAIWLYTKLTTAIIVDDWPDGGSVNADYWHSGIFLNFPADRIRRTATYHGERVDVHTIQFFASIPMDQPEFDRQLARWQTSLEFRKSNQNSVPLAENPHRPDWFPEPVPTNRVGSLKNFSWHCELFRRPNDDHLYIFQW